VFKEMKGESQNHKRPTPKAPELGELKYMIMDFQEKTTF